MGLLERILENVQPEPMSGCWLWLGHVNGKYGRVSVGGGRQEYVHRTVYRLLVGEIPAGMTIDHVRARGCSTTLCVNPEHLEPVTNRDNSMRGDTLAARKAAQTHCVHGHLLSGDNLFYLSTGKYRRRQCRECARRLCRETRARAKGRRDLGCSDSAQMNGVK